MQAERCGEHISCGALAGAAGPHIPAGPAPAHAPARASARAPPPPPATPTPLVLPRRSQAPNTQSARSPARTHRPGSWRTHPPHWPRRPRPRSAACRRSARTCGAAPAAEQGRRRGLPSFRRDSAAVYMRRSTCGASGGGRGVAGVGPWGLAAVHGVHAAQRRGGVRLRCGVAWTRADTGAWRRPPGTLPAAHAGHRAARRPADLGPRTSVAIWNSGLPLSPPASWPTGCEAMSPGRVTVVLLTIRPSTPCCSATAAMSARGCGARGGQGDARRGRPPLHPHSCPLGAAHRLLPGSSAHHGPATRAPSMSSDVRSGAILTSSGGGPAAPSHFMPSRVCGAGGRAGSGGRRSGQGRGSAARPCLAARDACFGHACRAAAVHAGRRSVGAPSTCFTLSTGVSRPRPDGHAHPSPLRP